MPSEFGAMIDSVARDQCESLSWANTDRTIVPVQRRDLSKQVVPALPFAGRVHERRQSFAPGLKRLIEVGIGFRSLQQVRQSIGVPHGKVSGVIRSQDA